MSEYSNYIVYVDESGDHGLTSVDTSYPVFVLAFCIFRKQDYINHAVPKLQNFKFQHFGHDQAILHEADIRRDRGSFSFLKSKALKDNFLTQLSEIIDTTPFTLISTVVKKEPYRQRYREPANPYHVALGYGLERVFYFLREQQQSEVLTHVIVEKRGKTEDDELELEFRRICAGNNYEHIQLPFEIVFADKKSNSAGLQFADLIARPIGIHTLRPDQPNHAFGVLEAKFYRNSCGSYLGRGLKCFP